MPWAPPEESLHKKYTAWKRSAKAFLKGTLRRQADALLPSGEIREYREWIEQRQIERKGRYWVSPRPGLFSILTPVWDGSPVRYLRSLAKSILEQDDGKGCEWVLLDNGCLKPRLLSCLKELGARPGVKLIREETNLGITQGLRRCLEEASGDYVLPVDADDLLYPDALRVIASAVEGAGEPPLLYTDEDKVIDSRRYQPYRKPAWDPVLLLNSAYIAHLGVIDRRRAVELGAYQDPATEGSPDWDLFVRFLIAGEAAVHIPEVVYSWRVHASSTADDAASKPYIASSQRSVLERYLRAQPVGKLFEIDLSPLFGGGFHWHFRRKEEKPATFARVSSELLDDCREAAQKAVEQDGFVSFIGPRLTVELPGWEWEAQGITELHPETVMVGGRIRNRQGRIVEAGLTFEADGLCGNPNRGRPANDPGYFGQVFKQRTVDAVSVQFAVVRARFLLEVLERLPAEASCQFLGAWAGAYAAETKRRVVYSPFLSGISDFDPHERVTERERAAFRERFAMLGDSRLGTWAPYKGRQS